jgi:CDP-glucose 4,6-dehydratase
MSEPWRGRSVLITGHTGFKGGWLALWLKLKGAQVHGYSLRPPTTPNLFAAADVSRDLASHTIADICDAQSLLGTVRRVAPEVVFHLAAQPLVRLSYQQPVDTYAVNVMGTVNLLEAIRQVDSVRAAVIVTSDKCYDNREWLWGYRENEALGGTDPYSSSKACCELVTAAYRSSFLAARNVTVSTVRAGNVIGGGDWASDRLIPDFLRALDGGQTLEVRYPQSTRPWQHVLEPLSGYLQLAEALFAPDGGRHAGPWNFGPGESCSRSVASILDYLVARVPTARWRHTGGQHPHEARSLRLDSSKAQIELGWSPRWDLETALDKTLEWHGAWSSGANMHSTSLAQIAEYESTGRR